MRVPKYLKFPLSKEASAFWLTFGAGAIAAVGILLAYASPFKVQVDWSFGFVDLLSAIGTVGAVVVALWFGVHANAKEKRAALSKSKAIGARLHPQLVIGVDLIDHFVGLLNDLPPPSRQAAYLPSGYGELIKRTSKSLCDAVNLPVWDTDMQQLAALEHIHCDDVLGLARAMGIICNARSLTPDHAKSSNNDLYDALNAANKRLSASLPLIQVAIAALEQDIQRYLNAPSRTAEPKE